MNARLVNHPTTKRLMTEFNATADEVVRAVEMSYEDLAARDVFDPSDDEVINATRNILSVMKGDK